MLNVKVSIDYSGLMKSAKENTEKLLEDVCKNAEIIARENYASARYDGVNDTVVSLNKIENGFELSAEGQSVFFLEYGSGISFAEGYPMEKPEGISEIGEYGKKKGQNPPWIFKNDGAVSLTSSGAQDLKKGFYLTYGNPPCMAMYKAISAILEMGK